MKHVLPGAKLKEGIAKGAEVGAPKPKLGVDVCGAARLGVEEVRPKLGNAGVARAVVAEGPRDIGVAAAIGFTADVGTVEFTCTLGKMSLLLHKDLNLIF